MTILGHISQLQDSVKLGVVVIEVQDVDGLAGESVLIKLPPK